MPRKRVVRLTDRPDMTLVDVYRGRKTTMQQQQQPTFAAFFCENVLTRANTVDSRYLDIDYLE